MRTIAVVNQKGGCGKTITAINLSAFLAREQRSVLLVDMDPQGHATLGLLRGAVPPSRTMYDVLSCTAGRPVTRLRDVIVRARENLDVAAADILLSAIPETLAGMRGREDILSHALSDVHDRYEYVVVDCPPNVGVLTFNALKACSEAIVPMDPSFFALHGIGKTLETFDVLARETDHHIAARALITLYSGRAPFVRAVLDEIRQHLAGRHFDTIVRYSVKLAEAASHGIPIVDYCRHCAGFDDYRALTAEVLGQETGPVDHTPVMAERIPSALTMRVERGGPSAPAVTPDGVVFTLTAGDAERVHLAGDFNGWSLDGSEMERSNGVWTKVLKLRPGRYRYRYVVDGQWRSDPLNAAVEPSPYGGENSVLVMGENSALVMDESFGGWG